MRLTINLDDDLYAMARAHAISEGISISKAVNSLLRLRHGAGQASLRKKCSSEHHPLSGFPVSKYGGQDPIPADAEKLVETEEDTQTYGEAP